MPLCISLDISVYAAVPNIAQSNKAKVLSCFSGANAAIWAHACAAMQGGSGLGEVHCVICNCCFDLNRDSVQ